jgi:cytosine deaminase
MQVLLAGGHGKIALELTRLLDERGDQVRSLIRNPDHATEVGDVGASDVVVCDLEAAGDEEVADAVGTVDAIVFAAGAGPGSGSERKETMDYGGVVKLLAAAGRNGVPRFVVISSMGADPDHQGDDTFDVYLRAKGKADSAVRESGLDYLIVKPGMLTDDPPAGTVEAAESVERGQIPRADVAAVIATLLRDPTPARTIEVVGGPMPIEGLAEQLARGRAP